LANLIAGALVFGQFISGQAFSILTFLLGIILAALQKIYATEYITCQYIDLHT
jgi:hypothetical protein